MTALDEIARAAIAQDGIASAVIFVTARSAGPSPAPGSDVRLAAAAGIAGPPLDGLIAAVDDPRHPIRQSMTDADPTWDVEPMNPGGPALRSHLPLRSPHAPAGDPAIGVLALAHDGPLAPAARARLQRLARQAAEAAVSIKQEEETQ